MTLASNYLDYAENVADFLKNPSTKTYRTVRLSASKVQESWYGVTIDPPKVLDGLEKALKGLLSGNSQEWERLLNPLTSTIPHSFPSFSASEPIYHRLVSIRQKLAA